jgi:hypothetical protein
MQVIQFDCRAVHYCISKLAFVPLAQDISYDLRATTLPIQQSQYRVPQSVAFCSYSVAFSPKANYNDWATVTCRRNLVPTFVDRWVSRGRSGWSPTVVNRSFLYRSRENSFQQFIYTHKGWVDPVPDPLLLWKSGSAGIEPGATESAARKTNH